MKRIIVDKRLPVVMIDTSHFIFHRYFHTLEWYKKRGDVIVFDRLHENATFMSAFEAHLRSDVKKLCAKWGTTFAQFLFCIDCPKANVWRHAYMSGYKAQRVKNPEFNPRIFSKVYKLLRMLGAQTLFIDKLEADDIVYLAKAALRQRGWKQSVIIITNDNDYLQLKDYNTYIYNMEGETIAHRGTGNPKIDLKVKTIFGDIADNIPPIHPDISYQSALVLAKLSDDALVAYLVNKRCERIYNKNKKLVDFTMLPRIYVRQFQKAYEFA